MGESVGSRIKRLPRSDRICRVNFKEGPSAYRVPSVKQQPIRLNRYLFKEALSEAEGEKIPIFLAVVRKATKMISRNSLLPQLLLVLLAIKERQRILFLCIRGKETFEGKHVESCF